MTAEETVLIRRCLQHWAGSETHQYNEHGCELAGKLGNQAVFRDTDATADFFALCQLAGVRPVLRSEYRGNFCHIEFYGREV